ncbi:glycosyltransferase [Methylocapsa sp. D3K7]|uniref:glycosyltransferase n=1 Tax=Methylocapsa sp. D3K7 TaxID=3041435 RepID=UPI00244EA319|nr:glycosyltransferase [Methylocapsa sp. D3K7]WGJ16063.1 glycosyltransferase [Methylocapsa sp. D3K7]
MRVAIVHYWLVSMRGGEKVVEALCQLFPGADIFTHVYDPEKVSETIRSHRIFTTFINSLPRARRYYKHYLPLMPIALEQLDLRGYDLIISSESGPAKGIIPPPGAVHLCYCHSPMRYVWNMFHDYRERTGWLQRVMMPPLCHYLRIWDATASMRVDRFIANSATVAARIEKYYRRDSAVIHPPVNVELFESVSPGDVEDYYLMAGELVAYKRPELAVEAFNALGRRLIVIGGGEMLAEVRKRAGPTVTVMGQQPFGVLRHHYARCRALVFPGEEDFGIVPVEVMASGRPVIAYGRGGLTESVVAGVSGLFFGEQTVAAIEQAVHDFEGMSFDPAVIKALASKFNSARFLMEFSAAVEKALGHKLDPLAIQISKPGQAADL